jgi:hypothetical protein
VQQAERQLGALELVTASRRRRHDHAELAGLLPAARVQGRRSRLSGQVIADVPDLATLRINARLEEAERGRMQQGQQVSCAPIALPDRELSGKIGEISTLARIDFSNWPPQRNFDLSVQLDQTDQRLRPGMNTSVRVPSIGCAMSCSFPVRAVFEKNGRTVAYVASSGGGW